MVVFTSDHGDYLGDHWLGEKDLFHEPAVKIPLIVVDPRPGAARGQVNDALIEAIDLAPTFVEAFGGTPKPHVLEGRSLMPLLHGKTPSDWRDAVISEYDYSMLEARKALGQPIDKCRLFMVFDGRWKYIHAVGMRPLLFDLETDPNEFTDLGADPRFAGECRRMSGLLLDWALADHSRITTPDARIAAYDQLGNGFPIGYWDEEELNAALAERDKT